MRVRTQQCPCLKITAGCTAAKFPILFFAAMEQGKNSHVLLAKRKSWHEQSLLTSLRIRNGSSVRTAFYFLFQVTFIFKYLKKKKKVQTGERCLLHFAVVTPLFLEMSVRSSLAEECVKSKVHSYCFRVTNTGSSTSRDPAVGMISIWTEFSMQSNNGGSGSFIVSVVCNIQEVSWTAFHL